MCRPDRACMFFGAQPRATLSGSLCPGLKTGGPLALIHRRRAELELVLGPAFVGARRVGCDWNWMEGSEQKEIASSAESVGGFGFRELA